MCTFHSNVVHGPEMGISALIECCNIECNPINIALPYFSGDLLDVYFRQHTGESNVLLKHLSTNCGILVFAIKDEKHINNHTILYLYIS